jgi:hypothetical protein
MSVFSLRLRSAARIPAGALVLLAIAGLRPPLAGQSQAVPDLAFIPYREFDPHPVPSVMNFITRAKMKLAPAVKRDLLRRLFEDRIPAIDYITAALNLGLDVSLAQREELVAREAAKSQDPEELAILKEKILGLYVQKNELEGYPDYTEGLYQFAVLDLDGDGRADLLLIPYMYFGPSAGVKFYGRDQARFVYLGEQTGDIRRIDTPPGRVVFRYVVNILDSTETGMILNYGWDRATRTWTVTKQYYAQQTEIPGRFQAPQAVKTAREAVLRTGPRADDGPPRTEHDENIVTTTLQGNIVARLAGNVKGFVYAVREGWAFAAFASDPPPLESSLYHDLDNSLDADRKANGAPLLKPYLCGWVRTEFLEGLR